MLVYFRLQLAVTRKKEEIAGPPTSFLLTAITKWQDTSTHLSPAWEMGTIK